MLIIMFENTDTNCSYIFLTYLITVFHCVQTLVLPTWWTFENHCGNSSQTSKEWDAPIQSLNFGPCSCNFHLLFFSMDKILFLFPSLIPLKLFMILKHSFVFLSRKSSYIQGKQAYFLFSCVFLMILGQRHFSQIFKFQGLWIMAKLIQFMTCK